MSIETISLIIAAFVNGSIGIAALMRNFRNPACLYFALFATLLFAHDTLCLLERFGSGAWFINPRLHAFVALLLGPSAVLLFRCLCPGYAKGNRVLWIYAGLILLFWVLSLAHFSAIHSWLYIFAHIAFAFGAVHILRILVEAEKCSRLKREKLRLRYALWGGVICLCFFISDALHFAGLAVPPLGTLGRVLYMIFVFQAFIQRELVTAEEVVGKLALFGGVAMILSVIYFLLVSWVGDRVGLFFFNTLIASFVILILFDPIRKLTRRFTRKLFLHRVAAMEDTLNLLAAELRGVIEPLEISRKLNRALKKCLEMEKSPTLYLLDSDGISYIALDGKKHSLEIYASDPLVEYMILRRGRPFILENIQNDRDSFYATPPTRFLEDCEATMRSIESDFIVPFMPESKVLGFCAIHTGEGTVLSNEQLRLFASLSLQVGILLKNVRAFKELSNRDKLAAAGEMAAGMAHEIKNPLGAIKGAAQLLQEGQGQRDTFNGSEEQKSMNNEFLQIIIDETDRLSAVLSDFLEYAKPRKEQPNYVCDPVRVIEHTVTLIHQNTSIPIELDLETKALRVAGDPELLKQVLLNLLMNAVDSLTDTKDPVIHVRLKEIGARKSWFAFPNSVPMLKKWEGWGAVGPTTQPSFVEVSVEDNGVGIPDKDLPNIFVPFYTTKPKGTGLGLAICQRLMERMGGSIHVKSNQPTGTNFTLHFPLHGGEPTGRRIKNLRHSFAQRVSYE